MSKGSEIENDKIRVRAVINHAISGSVAGILEVLVTHPLFTMKNRMQCGYGFTLNPRILYLGILGNASSMVPLATTQVVLSHYFFEKIEYLNFISKTNKHLISSFMAGVFSSFVIVPVELSLVQQQREMKPLFKTASIFLKSNPLWRFYVGLLGTALRTGFVSAGFIAVMPLIKEIAKNKGCNDLTSILLSGFLAGTLSTIFSHPFDTIKTVQQDSAGKLPLGFRKAFQTIKRDYGYVGFFRGVTARGARVISATTILGSVSKVTLDFLESKSDFQLK